MLAITIIAIGCNDSPLEEVDGIMAELQITVTCQEEVIHEKMAEVFGSKVSKIELINNNTPYYWYGEYKITLVDKCTTIPELAFYDCNWLTRIAIGEGIKEIEDNAFYSCGALEYISLPNSLSVIGDGAFINCESITHLILPENLITIGDDAFINNSKLEQITIPNNVKHLGKRAFANCESLSSFNGKFASYDGNSLIINGVLHSFAPKGVTSYSIPEEVHTIGEWVFNGCDELSYIIFHENVTTIKDYAFANSALKKVTIPNNVTNVGKGAFSGCENLTQVTISEKMKGIAENSFSGCKNLTSITIPSNIKDINDSAFMNCDELAIVYCMPTVPPNIGNNVFERYDYSSISLPSILVPATSLETYRNNAKWKPYQSQIKGYYF